MKVKVKSGSRVRLFAPPWTVPHHAPLSVLIDYTPIQKEKKSSKKKKRKAQEMCLAYSHTAGTLSQIFHAPSPHPNPLWLHFVPAETGSEQGPRSRGLPHLPLPQPCFPPSCTHAGIPGSTLVLISAASPLHLVADLSLRLGPPPLHLPVKSSSGPTS